MEFEITETCKQLIAQLSRFIDGELDAAVCEKIEQHLALCPYCRVVVDTTQKTIALYHAAPEAELPARARAHLIEILNLKTKES